MPTTYEPVVQQILTTSTSTVTFTSIPQTYTDLVLIISGTSTANGQAFIRFNNDSGGSYSVTNMYGDGSSAGSERYTSGSGSPYNAYGFIGNFKTGQGNKIIDLNNYSNTTTFKNYLCTTNNPSADISTMIGLWSSTSAISRIDLYMNGTTWASGTNFIFYGIANGDIGAYATGGTITYDANYFYHTFGTSDTFTPSRNLSNVDYLVVAGGGGGSSSTNNNDTRGSGGGGAGGLRSTVDASGGGASVQSKISVTSGIGYTITVGSGGSGGDANSYGSNTTSGNTSSIVGSGLTTIACAGGGRAGNGADVSGASGGSGGGGNLDTGSGGSGTANEGYAGGNAGNPNGGGVAGAGGGGGAGGAGITPTTSAIGDGGVGVAIPTMAVPTGTGVETYYAGGGGGGTYAGRTPGRGGRGGGGLGTYFGNTGQRVNAIANTGGGGGGSGNNVTVAGAKGGNGASGIVIIRYAR